MTMPRYSLRTLLTLLAIGPPLGAGVWYMPLPFSNASNCGGNNAALTYVSLYSDTLRAFAVEHPSKGFSLGSATAQQRQELKAGPNGWGITHNDIWICATPIHSESERPIIIVACSRAFTNVPQYLFRRADPTYAAGYSDGRTVLLTENQFAALDRTAFVRVSDITPE